MRVMIAAIFAVGLFGEVNAASERFLQVAVAGSDDAGKSICPVSLVYDINQEQLFSGAYYIADSSCGITAEVAGYRLGGMKFEMLYNIKMQTDDQGARLSGNAYALNYSGGEEMGGSERSSVEKSLTLGKKTLLCSFGLREGGDVQMYVTLLDKCPSSSVDCGENALTLITSVTQHGRPFSRNSQTQKLLAESMDFRSVMGSDSGGLVINYAASVRIPGGIKALREATKCRVEFLRNYQILSRPSDSSQRMSVVGYSSNNSQEVTLEPGKELRLVFPPDELSAKGIDIEDTLVIVPR